MKKCIYTILILFFSGTAVFAGWQIYQIVHEYADSEKLYSAVQNYARFHSTPAEKQNENMEPENSAEGTKDIAEAPNCPTVDFTALQAVNPDIIGWIYIEGTTVNYPIVLGNDNRYYLKHLINGEYNDSGAIFMDYRNNRDFSDAHTIIYGHHMKNGAMFSDLERYRQQAFYDEHTAGWIITPEANYHLEFFSGYDADTEMNAWQLDFAADSFENWLRDTLSRSCFESKVYPEDGDKIVTLSTCSYAFDNARFVLVGRIK